MEAESHSNLAWRGAELVSLWIVSTLAAGYHEVAGNIFVTLSILYLIWRWWRDYKKERVK